MSRRGPASAPLLCPSCGSSQPAQERFCPSCRVPLVHDPALVEPEPVDARRERARKIKPQLAEGPLMHVVAARNQAEGEFIQGLLLEEGVPSLLKRSAGFDVPDMLAAGPRDVLVPQTGLPVAREVLLQAEIIDERPAVATVAPGRLMLGLLAALAIGVLVVWLATVVVHH
jgi:hypothetical protein